jgi:hypothetical protein
MNGQLQAPAVLASGKESPLGGSESHRAGLDAVKRKFLAPARNRTTNSLAVQPVAQSTW